MGISKRSRTSHVGSKLSVSLLNPSCTDLCSKYVTFLFCSYIYLTRKFVAQYWNNIFLDKTLPLTFIGTTVIEELRKKPLPKVIFAPLVALEFLLYLSSFAKEVNLENSATNAGPVWAPFENFNINFFYCKVRFWLQS